MNKTTYSLNCLNIGDLAKQVVRSQTTLTGVQAKLSLEINPSGKKRKIQKSDFVKVMIASGLTEKIIANIAKKFRRSIVKWLDLIDASFLPEGMKKEYKKLILSRVLALR